MILYTKANPTNVIYPCPHIHIFHFTNFWPQKSPKKNKKIHRKSVAKPPQLKQCKPPSNPAFKCTSSASRGTKVWFHQNELPKTALCYFCCFHLTLNCHHLVKFSLLVWWWRSAWGAAYNGGRQRYWDGGGRRKICKNKTTPFSLRVSTLLSLLSCVKNIY